jgi:hypothetical protein
MAMYWKTDEEIAFREKLISIVVTELKMGHDFRVEESILDVLPELEPGEIFEWVEPDLRPSFHPFPLDDDFFDVFWKSVCLRMADICG